MPVKCEPCLVEVAEEVAKDNPALGAKPFHYRGLYAELSVATVHGQAALGLLDFDPHTKMPPNFHTARDDMSNIDPAVLEGSEQFAWALLKEIDRGAAGLEPEAPASPASEPPGEPAPEAPREDARYLMTTD